MSQKKKKTKEMPNIFLTIREKLHRVKKNNEKHFHFKTNKSKAVFVPRSTYKHVTTFTMFHFSNVYVGLENKSSSCVKIAFCVAIIDEAKWRSKILRETQRR